MTSKSRKLVAVLGAIIQMTVVTAAVAGVCSSDESGNSLGAVFSVIGDGVVNLKEGTATDQCNQLFYGATTVGAKSGNLKQSGAGNKACQAYATQADLAAGKSSAISTNGKSASARTLDAYSESTSAFDVKFPTSGQIQYGNSGGNSTNANNDGSFTLTADGRTVVVTRATVGGKTTYTVPGGDYDEVAIDNGVGIAFSGPVRIKKFHMASCNSYGGGVGVKFSVGANFINKFDWSAGCDLSVGGTTGTATLNILGKTNFSDPDPALVAAPAPQKGMVENATGLFIPSKSCINYSPCDPSQSKTWANMDAQQPARLQINVYHGGVVTQDSYSLAGGVYVDKGSYAMGNGTPVTVVGEILALNVETQNNTGSQFFSKASSMTTPGDSKTAGWLYSSYSMAAPIVASKDLVNPNEVTLNCSSANSGVTNGLAYVGVQKDGVTSIVDGKVVNVGDQVSGSLVAYELGDDGRFNKVNGVPVWDAAEILTKIMDGGTVDGKGRSWRDSVMYTNSGTGHDVAPVSTVYSATLAQYLLDPSNAQRGLRQKKDATGKGGAVFGRPGRTAPIVVGGAVLFATDDGFLYSINRLTGMLNWGWIPKDIAALADPNSPNSVMNRHPWGQLGSVTGDDGQVYVTGTALGGELHFGLKVSEAADQLQGIAFYDYRQGAISPGGSAEEMAHWADRVAFSGWPFGGAAPVSQAISGSGAKLAYIVDNKLVVRKADGSDAPLGATLSALGSDQATSNLVYWQDDLLYVGSKSGKVYEFQESGLKVQQKQNADAVDLQFPSNEPVFGINGIANSGSLVESKILAVQTKSQVSIMRYDNNDAGEAVWSFAWYTRAGGSKTTAKDIVVPAMPSGVEVTGLPALAGGVVMIPYTKDEIDSALCLKSADAKVKGAYSFGPLSILSGSDSVLYDGTTRQNLMREDLRDKASVRTDDGYAYSIQVLNYTFGENCGSSRGYKFTSFESTASGNTKTNFDAGTLPTGGGVTKNGAPSDESRPQGRDTHLKKFPAGKTRVNWRELTNFF